MSIAVPLPPVVKRAWSGSDTHLMFVVVKLCMISFFGDPNCYAIFRNEFMIVSKMVYIDNLDGYEEVYDEVEETPTTTDFIYYDAGKLARFSP